MKIEELMDNIPLSKRIMRKILFIIVFTVALVFAVFNLDKILGIGAHGLSILAPFLTGIAMAFVLNVLLKLFEEKVFAKLNRKNFKIWAKCRRGVCILLSFIAVSALIAAIVFFVIPEVIKSTRVLTDNLPVYFEQFSTILNQVMEELDITQDQIKQLKVDWTSLFSYASQFTTDFMGSLMNGVKSFASGVIGFVLSLIFSIYMLVEKERISKNLKRLLYAFLSREKAAKTVEVASITHKIFSGFVTGQLLEAVIIGVLCYIGMSIIQLPYALLISTLISITAVIPILGAYLGAAIGGVILLLVEPRYCLWFVIFIILLQQFEGNVIYPKVVGTSIGLPGIWVLLAVLISGDLFGIVGVLLGVPTCSVIYTLLKRNTVHRLKIKEVTETEMFLPIQKRE